MMHLLAILFGWAGRSALTILLALMVCFVIRKSSAATRHLVLRSALASTCVIGMGLIFAPRLEVPVQTGYPLATVILPPSIPLTMHQTDHVTGPNFPSENTAFFAGPVQYWNRPTLNPWQFFSFLYSFGVLILCVRWLAGFAAIRSIYKTATRVEGFENAFGASGSNLGVPITFGWWNPVIILPRDYVSWPKDTLNAVILHERAHISRRDWAWQTAANLVVAFQWFNPAVWLLSSSLRASAEESADNEVLAAGIASSTYAQELMAFAMGNHFIHDAAVAYARKGGIRMRLNKILDGGVSRSRAVPATGWSYGVCAIVLGFSFASISPAMAVSRLSALQDLLPASMSNAHSTTFKDGAKGSISYIQDAAKGRTKKWNANGSPHTVVNPNEGTSRYSMGEMPEKRGIVVNFEISDISPSSLLDDPENYYVAAFLGGISWQGLGGGFDAGPVTLIENDKKAPSTVEDSWPRAKYMGSFEPPRMRTLFSGTGTYRGDAEFIVPAAWKVADFEIGRGIGKYRPLFDNIGAKGKGNFTIEPQKGQGSRSDGNKTIKVEFTQCMIRIRLPKSVLRQDWRLLAYDQNGKTYRVRTTLPQQSLTQPKAMEAIGFYADSPASIKRLVLEARDLQWVKFKQVALFPADQSTQTK